MNNRLNWNLLILWCRSDIFLLPGIRCDDRCEVEFQAVSSGGLSVTYEKTLSVKWRKENQYENQDFKAEDGK